MIDYLPCEWWRVFRNWSASHHSSPEKNRPELLIHDSIQVFVTLLRTTERRYLRNNIKRDNNTFVLFICSPAEFQPQTPAAIQLSQFSWWPSARRAHFIVTFMRFTLIAADLGDYDSALSWDSGRRSASPPRRFANESTSTWHPVR